MEKNLNASYAFVNLWHHVQYEEPEQTVNINSWSWWCKHFTYPCKFRQLALKELNKLKSMNSFPKTKYVVTCADLVGWCWMCCWISLPTPANALAWLAAPWTSVWWSWCWIALATRRIQWNVFVTASFPGSTSTDPNRSSCDGYVVIVIVPVALSPVGA
jgi:hypothetical protein